MSGDRVGRLLLSGLLSQVLVAFTIECDNEFERQMPHRTSNYGSTAGRGAGPWLVSVAMWWTCMRFVGADGITVAELTRRARTGTNLPGMTCQAVRRVQRGNQHGDGGTRQAGNRRHRASPRTAVAGEWPG